MDRQALSTNKLNKIIRKSDFKGIPAIEQDKYRQELLADASKSIQELLSGVDNPLVSFNLHGNRVYKLKEHHHRLIERGLTKNLRRVTNKNSSNRNDIIDNLKLLLSENVPYKIYRWDITKFFESFDKIELEDLINKEKGLSPQIKNLVISILRSHQELGGRGCPRGLSLSSILTELMMDDFDNRISNHTEVFFYARYVDDIIIITSTSENTQKFKIFAKDNLPNGLQLNTYKSQESPIINVSPSPKKQSDNFIYSFEYLGYKISIKKKTDENKNRIIDIDMADRKVKKYKKRISRSFYDFIKTGNTELLIDRLRFLTKNFKVYNRHLEKTKLSGIYYNYPAIQGNMSNLKDLDGFIKALVLGRRGRLGKSLDCRLNSSIRSRILANSFVKGHKNIAFATFSPERVGEIKTCWAY